jgi:uncharacterized damage-inducible protein DinB
MNADVAAHYLDDVRLLFRKYRELAERALAQADDAAFFAAADPEANSIALVVKHVAGNLRSRWTDFLTTDGEKPDRRRDAEFEREGADTRATIMARWAQGWATLFATLDALGPQDLLRTITIRGEPHTALQALQRQATHYAYHVGQIVLLARLAAGPAWRSLSIPRGESARYEVARDGSSYLAEPPR